MKKTALCALLSGFLLTPTTQAATLAVMDFSLQHHLPSSGTASDSVSIRFSYSSQPRGLTDIDSLIFDSFVFGTNAAGGITTLTSNADDPNYSHFLSYLLSPAIDDIRVDIIGNNGGGIGQVGPESGLLHTPNGNGFTDLPANSFISALQLSINDITIDPNASNGQFNWAVTGQLQVIGGVTTVPLPAAAPLFGAATLLTLAASMRHRHRKPSSVALTSC